MKSFSGLFRLGITFVFFSVFLVVNAQSDMRRETIAITYPLDQSVTVKFRGTTRLSRMFGEAKVKRQTRRGTRVELSIDNLPRATEIGGHYTTYVLWAITPEGRVDNLGEIKRSGNSIISSKIDVTTPLQTFSLLVTAEPHFLVRGPSRMVVLENLPPINPGSADISTVAVHYLGNSSDYFNDPRIPEMADPDFKKTPVSLLGARQAISLARYAGAERDAESEIKDAQAQLQLAEEAWRLNLPEAEVDAAARKAISLGALAEEAAETRKAARSRRDDISRRDEAVREAEATTATANAQIQRLRSDLDKERRARELADRDAVSSNQQIRELRTEVVRLREELQTVRAEGEEAKIKLARIEGERRVEDAQRTEERRVAQLRQAATAFRQGLEGYGPVKETGRGLTVVIAESVWANPRGSALAPAGIAKLDTLAALLANNPDYMVTIESFTDSRGDAGVLAQITQDRARVIADRFVAAGVDNSRILVNGLGASNPVAPNTTVANRARNRRTEITFSSPKTQSSGSIN